METIGSLGFVGRVRGHRSGHAGHRPVRRRRRQGAPRQLQGGRHLVGDLDQPSSLAFAGGLWWYLDGSVGREIANSKALEFITGYLIEKSLAVDNVFVWLMLFSFFARPARTAEARAVLGRARRHRHAHGHDLRRRLADHPVPLDALRVRRLPAVTGVKMCWFADERAGPREQPAAEVAARRTCTITDETARPEVLHRGETACATRRRCSSCWCWSRSPT